MYDRLVNHAVNVLKNDAVFDVRYPVEEIAANFAVSDTESSSSKESDSVMNA